jgi:hypothetical protein
MLKPQRRAAASNFMFAQELNKKCKSRSRLLSDAYLDLRALGGATHTHTHVLGAIVLQPQSAPAFLSLCFALSGAALIVAR